MDENKRVYTAHGIDLSKPQALVIGDLRNQLANAKPAPPNQPMPKRLEEKIRKLKIENDNAESDQNLKKITLYLLFGFLGMETAAVFVLAFFQGFKSWGFEIEAWSFRLLVAVTISQITAMLFVAVHHLFPARARH